MKYLLIPLLILIIFLGKSATSGVESYVYEVESNDEELYLVSNKSPVFVESEVLGSRSYYDILKQYDWDAETMYRVLLAESSGNPNAINHNDKHRTCRGSYGLMQLSCEHLANYGIWDSWDNPEENIRVSYNVWQKQGYRAWGAYTSGAYLRY